MFTTETLFVLGAGASVSYGFPLGSDLIECILKDMDDEIFIPTFYNDKSPPYWNHTDRQNNIFYDFSKFQPILLSIANTVDGITRNDFIRGSENCYNIKKLVSEKEPNKYFKTSIKYIDNFNALKIALEEFTPISIDTFLRDNPCFAIPGKIMIIYSLLKREDKTKISSSLDNWYPHLLNELTSNCAGKPELLNSNKVKFLTFNYDESLDYYLTSKLAEIEVFKQKSATSEKTIAEEYINSLIIAHVYGKINSEKDYGYYNNNIKEESGENNNRQLPSAQCVQNFKRFVHCLDKYKEIKTMYDDRLEIDKTVYESYLINADEIIFIGFGFDRDNLNIIGFPNTLEDYKNKFSRHTIRYLNFNNSMNSLSREFKELEKNCRIKVISSTANSICNAYQNDFKKSLFKNL